MTCRNALSILFPWAMVVSLLGTARADEPNKDAAEPQKTEAAMGEPAGLTKISKDYPVWIDLKRKLVVVDGQICLHEGQLEMFACPKGTKEHESLVSVNSNAQIIHTGLLAVGAKAGSPVKFDPTYVPAKGTVVEIVILWTDKDGKQHKTRAQEWIRNVKTGKEMESSWVFAGSGFWTDESDGKRFYHGDSGDFVCVSNFPTATLDLPVESSQINDALLFEVFKERVPPRGTKVRMVLIPKLDEKDAAKPKNDSSPPKDDATKPSK